MCSVLWLRSVMVITPDSDSGNPGSIPGATFLASFISLPSFFYQFAILIVPPLRPYLQQEYAIMVTSYSHH